MSLLDHIPAGSLVAIDTVIWIYQFEDNSNFGPITDELFRNGFGAGYCRAACSLLVLGEILVQPLSLGRLVIADNYRRIIMPGPHLTVWDLNRDVIDTAAALRAKYRLRMLDAIHVACAMVNRADRFLTNDVDLRKVNEIPILILSDFLPVAP
jgi:predicted nucleic acid-binding protein